MKTIDRFSLERHAGEYHRWPRRTRLFLDGRPTSTKLAGYHLMAQLQVDDRFLLVLDHACPFEEAYDVYLLSPDLRVLSHASDPSMALVVFAVAAGAITISAGNLYGHPEVIDDRTVRLRGDGPPHLRITVRDSRPFGVGSLLRVRHETEPS